MGKWSDRRAGNGRLCAVTRDKLGASRPPGFGDSL